MATATLNIADEKWGYPFGVDGLVSAGEACKTLGNISMDTLNRRVTEGYLRKGKHPAGDRRSRVGICRRSLADYIKSMEV